MSKIHALLAGGVLALAAASPALAAPSDPPPVTITASTPAARAGGDIFITPTGQSATYANGPEILDPTGKVVWFHPIPQGQVATDFRTQTYQGRPVLTFTQGVGANGVGKVTDHIFDSHYREIATVQAGHGQIADSHEFLITARDTALITIYAQAQADLSAIGGPADQTVIDGIVQEIDIRTGRVLFEWNSADHVPYGDSHQPLPASASTPWDWFHINAVHVDTDGNLLIDSRHTWTAYKVDRRSGRVIWQLGGRHSSFALRAAPGQTLDSAGAIFAWQHDPEPLGHDRYTIFDNDSSGTPLLPASRAVTIQLDEARRTATLVASDAQPQGLAASSQGNAQNLPGGGRFVGWGNLNHFSQFDRRGRLVLDAAFPAGVNTYRAYRLPWHPGH